jgi:hypothetical protein
MSKASTFCKMCLLSGFWKFIYIETWTLCSLNVCFPGLHTHSYSSCWTYLKNSVIQYFPGMLVVSTQFLDCTFKLSIQWSVPVVLSTMCTQMQDKVFHFNLVFKYGGSWIQMQGLNFSHSVFKAQPNYWSYIFLDLSDTWKKWEYNGAVYQLLHSSRKPMI